MATNRPPMPRFFTNRENQEALWKFLEDFTFKPGWEFGLFPGERFRIAIETKDSTGKHFGPELTQDSAYGYALFGPEEKPFKVMHTFNIPVVVGTDIERFVLDCIIQVETHEAMEFFKLDGKAIFMPDHSSGGDPYKIERK